jgi:hypothetical protein
MDTLVHIYNTMLLGISIIAASLSLSLGIVTPHRQPETFIPKNSIEIASQKSTTSDHVYQLTFFDVDTAKDKTHIQSTVPDPKKSAVIQKTLNVHHIRQDFAQSYAIVFSSESAGSTQSGISTVYFNGKPVPLPRLNTKEKGLVNDFHKCIILRSSLTGDELASVYMHELGHVAGYMLSAEQFKEFMQTRQMKKELIDSWYEFYKQNRQGTPPLEIGNWNANPSEDFAEVFRSIIEARNRPVSTMYGPISGQTVLWFTETVLPMVVQ